MEILVVCGSQRNGGNTEIMAQAFAQGARESGNSVTVKKLSSLKVAPCLDCEYCFTHGGACIQHDGMAEILEAFDKADMLVIASPIYWFDITAQTKAVIDRLYAREKTGYRQISTALLLDSESDDVYTAAIASYKAIDEYLHWTDRGIITISGMALKGSMNESPELKKVIDLGKSLR